MWDVTNWADCVEGLGGYCSLCLQSDGCVYNLDAESQHIGEGDQVQIFTLNGGANQEWKSQPLGLEPAPAPGHPGSGGGCLNYANLSCRSGRKMSPLRPRWCWNSVPQTRG